MTLAKLPFSLPFKKLKCEEYTLVRNIEICLSFSRRCSHLIHLLGWSHPLSFAMSFPLHPLTFVNRSARSCELHRKCHRNQCRCIWTSNTSDAPIWIQSLSVSFLCAHLPLSLIFFARSKLGSTVPVFFVHYPTTFVDVILAFETPVTVPASMLKI